MRLFVAINLPPDVREALWASAAPLRDLDLPVRWTKPEAIHLTLKFLGDVAPDREREMADAVQSSVLDTSRFLLPINGFGAFPNAAKPRVVWVGCDAVPPLELLQDVLERRFDTLGFPIDGRPFRPHLTLGRMRRDAKPTELRALAPALDELSYATQVEVQSVDLMESILARSGATYSTRHRATLAS